MKYFLYVLVYLLSLNINAQDDVINYLNQISIEIEDANPNSKLENFHENIPEKFKNAKIFGFGEATHHGKEFFDIKAKFFKYLVETKGVRVFIMEESYPAESGINEWISGGKGDIKTIANNFNIVPWSCSEVVNLLEWMRNYNFNKSTEEQIRFYGMDIQNVNNIDQEIRAFVKKYRLPINEKLLSIVDNCVNKTINYKKSTDWADIQISKLREIEQAILDFQNDTDAKNDDDLSKAIRALNYLMNYTYYVAHSESVVRDLKMFENVKWIVDNKAKNGKAFIWAHNEHINNKEMLSYGSGWINLGAHLKKHFKDDYYSVYFDFGTGKVIGYVDRKNKLDYWDVFEIDKPFQKTYAKTLLMVNKDIYFVDMDNALKSEAKSFFKEKKKQHLLGGSGYNPRHKSLISKKYSEMFDGLIFIKNISLPNYKLNED